MARTTVEDCIAHCENHFELVHGIVNRAKWHRKNETSFTDTDDDRPIVKALREVASGAHVIDLDAELRDNLAQDEALTAGEIGLAPEITGDSTSPTEPAA